MAAGIEACGDGPPPTIAHDLLTSETWQAASRHAIVTQALKPFQEQHHERIAVEGPADVWLDSTKSVVLAMVVHELATNAFKYGALSNGSGYVSVKWMQHSQPSLVKLVWQESGVQRLVRHSEKALDRI